MAEPTIELIEARIREHIRLIYKYMAEGMTRDAASQKAYSDMGMPRASERKEEGR